MKNTERILSMTDQFWENVFQVSYVRQVWEFVFRFLYGLVLFILGINLIADCLLLAGLAHFATGNQQVILKDVRERALKFLVSYVIGISCLLDRNINEAFTEQSLPEKLHPDNVYESTPSKSTPAKMRLWAITETATCHDNKDDCSPMAQHSQNTQTESSFLLDQSFKTLKNDGETISVLKASSPSKERTLRLVQFCEANESI